MHIRVSIDISRLWREGFRREGGIGVACIQCLWFPLPIRGFFAPAEQYVYSRCSGTPAECYV